MRFSIAALLLALLLGNSLAFGEENRDADRRKLQIMLSDIEHGINDGNIEMMVRYIDDSAVVTWLNAEVSQGPEGVRSYFKKMVGNGKDAILDKYVTHPKLDKPARFYGDIAVANGTTDEEFTPHRRSVFNFNSRWTATMLKKDDQWKIVSLNLSTNTFNNVLITELERYAVLAGVGGLLAGMFVTAGWFYLRRRKTNVESVL